MALYPSVNDRDYDLLKKIAYNAGIIADSGGGGGGGSYATAANFAALPPAGLFSGTTYLAIAAQGVYFVNRKPAGLYRSNGVSWVYMADATEAYFQDTLAWSNITSKPATFPPEAHAANHSNGGSDPVTITNLAGFTGDTTKFLRADGTFQTAGGGSGDVVGPASAVNDRIAVFDLTTGKLIKDGGKTIATVLSDAASDATTKANAAQAAAIAASQPLDSDLTAIAALTPSNDDILQRKAGAWTNRTIAQLITDLALTPSSVGLGNVTNDAQTKAAIVPNTAPAAGRMLVGNAGGTAYAPVAMSGDATLASTGALTVANAAITLAKMANLAQDQFIGRVTASTGVPETTTITAAARTVLDDASVGAMVDTLGGATSTGTGGLARATSPTFVTPNLGTPASGNLANCTFPTLNQNTSGTAAGLSATLAATSGGTGQSTFAKGDILASPGSNTLNKLAVGTDGYVLTADAASTNGVKWAAGGGGGGGMTNPMTTAGDIIYGGASGTPARQGGPTQPAGQRLYYVDGVPTWATELLQDNTLWFTSNSGAGSGVALSGSAIYGSQWGVSTGTSGAAYATTRHSSASSEILFGGRTIDLYMIGVKVSALSDGTNTFTARFGFLDTTSGESTDGAYIYHDSSSGNWLAKTISGGSATTASGGSSVAVVADTYADLRIKVNAAGTLATFYVWSGGAWTSIGTCTTNIPTGAGRNTGYGVQVSQTAGTTSRTATISPFVILSY